MKIDKLKDLISDSINRNDPNAEAYLFGSRARNDFHANSDWDILILVDDEKITNEVEDKFRDELYDLELEFGQIISTYIYSKEYWKSVLIHTPLSEEVQSDGVKL